MSVRPVMLLGVALLAPHTPAAAEDEMPDAAFLEYLGFWEESDEEWLIFTDTDETEEDDERDAGGERTASTEKQDED